MTRRCRIRPRRRQRTGAGLTGWRRTAEEYGAEIVGDDQYEIDSVPFDAATADSPLDDVVQKVRATDAWQMGYTGKGVVIAVG